MDGVGEQSVKKLQRRSLDVSRSPLLRPTRRSSLFLKEQWFDRPDSLGQW